MTPEQREAFMQQRRERLAAVVIMADAVTGTIAAASVTIRARPQTMRPPNPRMQSKQHGAGFAAAGGPQRLPHAQRLYSRPQRAAR